MEFAPKERLVAPTRVEHAPSRAPTTAVATRKPVLRPSVRAARPEPEHLIERLVAAPPRNEAASLLNAAPPRIQRSPAALIQRDPKKGWGKIKSVVDKSKEFNEGTTPSKQSGDSAKTTTAGGAWLASQVGSQEKIGSVDDYMGSRDDKNSQQSKHLEQFLDGGHAFITCWIHKQIFNLNEDGSGWGGWGRDANFIAPLASANELVANAAKPGARGIWDLEVALGIPEGSWVKGCAPSYSIMRYIVHDPAKLNMRIPSGNESGAYGSWWNKDQYQAGQWNPKGKTEGGAAEAVIDKISLADLTKLGKDVLEIVEEKSLAANTKRVVDEKAVAAAASAAPSSAPSAAPAPG